jgi:hypothetical protein
MMLQVAGSAKIFYVQLSYPIGIHGKIFICSWLAEVWAQHCYRHLHKIPLAFALTGRTITLRSTLSGGMIETDAHPHKLLR